MRELEERRMEERMRGGEEGEEGDGCEWKRVSLAEKKEMFVRLEIRNRFE